MFACCFPLYFILNQLHLFPTVINHRIGELSNSYKNTFPFDCFCSLIQIAIIKCYFLSLIKAFLGIIDMILTSTSEGNYKYNYNYFIILAFK